MRNPNRIDPILKQLGDIWHKHPDLRLCQILSNATDLYNPLPRCQECLGTDLYYIEDEQIQEGLRREHPQQEGVEMKLTNNQLHTLRHMLGINTPNDRVPKPYRDYAAVSPGDAEFLELERLGAVERYTVSLGEYTYFRCTEAGKLAAMRSHRAIRKGKPQRRYSVYLDICDSYQDLTFKDFLTNPKFKEARDNA